MPPLHPLFRRFDNEGNIVATSTGEIAPESPSSSVPIGAIVAAGVSTVLIFSICLLPTGTMAKTYDWARRGFKPAPPVNIETLHVFFNPRLNKEAERKRLEEEANKSFVQRHLENLRAWRKPTAQQDPETGFKAIVPEPPMPPPAVQPSRFAELYARYIPFKKTETVPADAKMAERPRHCEGAEKRIQALKAKFNGRALPATTVNAVPEPRGPMQATRE